MKGNIIIVGGDGFCGWPTSLHLSKQGYNVFIIDNLSRRNIDNELGIQSLTPIKSTDERLSAWKEVTGRNIISFNIDVSKDYEQFRALLDMLNPKAVVHFGEIRAAPYSMKSSKHKRFTVDNNTNATHNILSAIAESDLDIHLIHLGTAGTNGYVTTPMDIPEGYLDVKVTTDDGEQTMNWPWPLHHASIYHLTKSMDFCMFQFYAKNDNLKITDLRQGIVWGTQTPETKLDERLINRFDWESEFGTVLNRFLVQSVLGHPLTVHGTGGQTRAFIHIKDTVRCIEMAINNPPKQGERVKIYNQNAETFNVRDLALKIQDMTDCEIRYYKNPRKEAEQNDLRVNTANFKSLGWEPILLDDGLLEEVTDIAKKYKDRCDKSKIICTSTWRKDFEVDFEGSETEVK